VFRRGERVSIRSSAPLAFVSSLVIAACGARTGLLTEEPANNDAGAPFDSGRPHDAGRDAPRDVSPDVLVLDPICVVPDGGVRDGACTKVLTVLDLQRSMPSCFVDVVIAVGQTGTLTYDCAGGGALVQFGNATFRGSFNGARLDVCIGTSFDWQDG